MKKIKFESCSASTSDTFKLRYALRPFTSGYSSTASNCFFFLEQIIQILNSLRLICFQAALLKYVASKTQKKTYCPARVPTTNKNAGLLKLSVKLVHYYNDNLPNTKQCLIYGIFIFSAVQYRFNGYETV